MKRRRAARMTTMADTTITLLLARYSACRAVLCAGLCWLGPAAAAENLKSQISNFKFPRSNSQTGLVARSAATPAAQNYFTEGLALVQQQRYRDAIRLFNAAARSDPGFAEAYFNLGACHERLDEFAVAVPWYEKAIALDPRNDRFHVLYGTALLRHAQPARAVAVLERAAYLAPGGIETLYYLGMGYVAVTQYALAATCFETMAGLVTNSSEAWYNVGLARLHAGQTAAATHAFAQVDLDAPVAAEAHYHLGAIAAAAGDLTGAVRAAKMATALAPGLPDAEELLAATYARQGDYQAACAAYERLHVLRPAERTEHALGAVYAAWGSQAFGQHHYAVALDRYQQAARYLPEEAEIQVQLARCATALQRDEVARAAVRRARQLATTIDQEERLHAVDSTLTRRAHPPVDKRDTF
jgi:tetratricopeptide (TPR) repeat protein